MKVDLNDRQRLATEDKRARMLPRPSQRPMEGNPCMALLALLWILFSGCEMEHGKGGFVDRSVAEDLRQQGNIEICTEGKRWSPHKPSVRNCAANDPRPVCKPGCYGSDE